MAIAPSGTVPQFWRRLVVVLYLGCIAFFGGDVLEHTRRVHLADEIAPILRNPPETVDALEEQLGGVTRAVKQTRHGTNDKNEAITVIRLWPRLWLHVAVVTEADSGEILRANVIYANSEIVDLEDPASSLPGVPWKIYGLFSFIGILLILLWLRSTVAPYQGGTLKQAGWALAATPLLVYIPAAWLAFMRIMM